jgi:hypothetical protein
MADKTVIHDAFDKGRGIFRLAPAWVPRAFCVPGRRIKLHPADYYAFGLERGGIDERWLSSTTPADNGPKTTTDEGMSALVFQDGAKERRALLRDAVSELKGALIGDRIWNAFKKWPSYSKFFDNKNPLPFHIHPRQTHAEKVGGIGKPEAYYFPPQLNNYGGDFPYTFFGLRPATTRDQLRGCLEAFVKGDNRITNLSAAYRLEAGTGWDVPAGILHAPGSLCTYEPQRDSDMFAMYQSVTGDAVVSEDLLWRNTPDARRGDFDYLLEAIDWELNLDPVFAGHHFMQPRPVVPPAQSEQQGYRENWICYKAPGYSAKELTVLPGGSVTIKDAGAYGMIVLQGHGTMGEWHIEAPALIRFGQLTSDEFFVSEARARQGVTFTNPSDTDPIVILKHFGPENPDLKLEA